MKPEDLIDKTKVYQFIKQTQSRNTIDKLILKDDIKSLNKLLKLIDNWQKWHLSKRLEKPTSEGEKIKSASRQGANVT